MKVAVVQHDIDWKAPASTIERVTPAVALAAEGIAAGLDHFCAIAAGDVSCWGFPPVGLSVDAIGEGASRVQSTPLRVE